MAAATTGPHRLFTVDALKGFAITCVVMGHALLRNVPEPASNGAYLLLSAFEMPLFMFLSGYVLPGRVRGSRVAWVWKRAIRLMVPFVAWHAIFYLSLRVTTLGQQSLWELLVGLVGYLAKMIAAPTAGLWYLPSLLLCSIGLAVLFPLRTRPLVMAAVGWLGFAGLLLVRDRLGISADFGLLKTATYWLFFASGYAWGEWKRSLQPERPRWRWAPVLLYPLVAVPLMRAMPSMGAVASGVSKVALGLAGTAFSAVLLEVALPVARKLRLDALGRLTLGVYCSQWLFLRVEFAEGALGVLAAFAFTMAGSIATTWVLMRVPVVRGVLLGEWPKPGPAAV